LEGTPPFQINYNIARDTDNGGLRLVDQLSFSSIQSTSHFQMQTSAPGRVYYEITAVGDASYLLQKNTPLYPISSRLRFEQQVYARPTAFFRRSDRASYCLHDAFVHRGDLSTDGTIVLKGTPPFVLELSVKNLASSDVHKEIVETSNYEWNLNIPQYTFLSIGPHLVTIDSIRDASNCPHSDLDAVRRQLWIDVAESAVIVPFDRREDYCVGEALQFQLEGTPPWRIQ
jgi:nucleoporin POM152